MADRFTILQWNMNGFSQRKNDPQDRSSRLNERLRDLVAHENPEVLLLQETPDGVAALLTKMGFLVAVRDRLITGIRASNWVRHTDVQPATERRTLLATYRRVSDGTFLITWNVHLPSLARTEERRIEEAVRELVEHADAHRGSLSLQAFELIGGDFNLPPFNGHVMRSQRNYLRAGRSAAWAQAQEHETSIRHFVNTAWRLLGRTEEPLASLFADKDPVSFQLLDDAPWHQFDQVLLSPSLLRGRVFSCDLRTAAGNVDLFTKGNIHRRASRARGSDHYPIVVQLDDAPLAKPTAPQTTSPLP